MHNAKLKNVLICAITAAIGISSFNASANTMNRHTTVNYTSQGQAQAQNGEQLSIEDQVITLSRADKERAKGFDLTDHEYAKYKYIMNFTPRGTWTKDIDPVLALGITANTESERLKYANILFQQRKAREAKEVAFALTMMSVEKRDDPTSPRWKPWSKRLEFALGKNIDEAKYGNQAKRIKAALLTEKVSVFVNPAICLQSESCVVKMKNAAKAKQESTDITFYLLKGNDDLRTRFVNTVLDGFSPDINVDNIKQSQLSRSHPRLPFLLVQNKNGEKVVKL